ncbi:MAG: bifunctional nuclease family protein [Chloroflexota bacterium]|nr:bifunctional nuclease family protein [Chloroflexota bacterium]
MVEAVIEAIRQNIMTDQHVVVLRETQGSRVVPIWITTETANAIAAVLQGQDVPRPLTHDLLRTVISEMGGTVSRVIVSDIKDRVFFALIEIEHDGRRIQIDSRSSDAIALAVRAQEPIFLAEHVLEEAGIAVPTEPVAAPEEETGPAAEPIDNESLSVFRDFVNNLDLDEPQRDKD